MKASNVSVMCSNMNAQFIGTTGEVEITYVADVSSVEVQQLVTEQRLITAQLYLTHLCTRRHTLKVLVIQSSQ